MDNQTLINKLQAAVSVIVLDPKIRKWLADNDPKALDQCAEAYTAFRHHFVNEWRPSTLNHEDFSD